MKQGSTGDIVWRITADPHTALVVVEVEGIANESAGLTMRVELPPAAAAMLGGALVDAADTADGLNL